mgnify:CR=1 FL=1
MFFQNFNAYSKNYALVLVYAMSMIPADQQLGKYSNKLGGCKAAPFQRQKGLACFLFHQPLTLLNAVDGNEGAFSIGDIGSDWFSQVAATSNFVQHIISNLERHPQGHGKLACRLNLRLTAAAQDCAHLAGRTNQVAGFMGMNLPKLSFVQHLFFAAKIKDLTGGDSLASNIQLVYNNAKLAAATAVELSKLAKN